MTRPVLPTAALTPARVPPPGASTQALTEFSSLDDRYDALSGSGEAQRIGNAWQTDGLGRLSLDDLRTVLLAEQRAIYFSSWFYEDHEYDRMRVLTDEIRRRVAAGVGPAVSVWTGDLTHLATDAVVNAANERMLGGGGVDGAIHAAAGPRLAAACRAIPEVRPGVRCPTGEARITPGFGLPARHVVHTVGPVWSGGESGEDAALAEAYRSSLALAAEVGAETVAFPAVSTGVYGFPPARAARIAVDACRAWAGETRRVVLVAFSEGAARPLREALG